MQAYTDASVIDGHSMHSFILLNRGKIILRNCIKEDIRASNDAEARSIILLLLECKKKGIKGITVHTDNHSLATVRETKKNRSVTVKINELLIETGSELKWISRGSNKVAHNLCKFMNRIVTTRQRSDGKVEIDSSKHFFVKAERHAGGYHRIGVISKDTLKDSERNHIKNYYNSLVRVGSRKSVDDLLVWGIDRQAVNNKKGRVNFVERYIARHHTIEDIHFDELRNVFEPFYLDETKEGIA